MKNQLTLQTIYKGSFVKFKGYSFGNEAEILFLFYDFEINGSLFNIIFGDRKSKWIYINNNIRKIQNNEINLF